VGERFPIRAAVLHRIVRYPSAAVARRRISGGEREGGGERDHE
jgi:hypothetical protein